jgi:hypothetical protein
LFRLWQRLLAQSGWVNCVIAVAILAPGLTGAAVLALSSNGARDAGGAGQSVVAGTTRTSTSPTRTSRSETASPTRAPTPLETPAPTEAPAQPIVAIQPAPQTIVVQQPLAQQPTTPPAPLPTPKPSVLPQWNECQSTRNHGTEVETIKNTRPGVWNSDYEKQYQSLMSYDQTSCIGIGRSLAETDGSIHCASTLSSAAALQAQMQQLPGLLSWYFPQRNLDELQGYINAAGC